jgi:hypothetical protein
MSLDSYLDKAEEGSSKCDRKKMRYPERNVVHDLTQTIILKLGLKFTNPSQFKDVLRLYAIQEGFEYTYLQNGKKRMSSFCKRIVVREFKHPR